MLVLFYLLSKALTIVTEFNFLIKHFRFTLNCYTKVFSNANNNTWLISGNFDGQIKNYDL